MGQKINSIGFRLGNRRAWNMLCATESTNFCNTFLSGLETSSGVSKIFERLGLITNNLTLRKSAKSQKIYGQLFNGFRLSQKWKTSSFAVQEQEKKKRHFLSNFSSSATNLEFALTPLRWPKNPQLFRRILLLSEKKFRDEKKPHGKKKINGDYSNQIEKRVKIKEDILSYLKLILNSAFLNEKSFNPKDVLEMGRTSSKKRRREKVSTILLERVVNKTLYPSITAEAIATYIKEQMNLSPKVRTLNFRQGLKTGISQLALFLFKQLSVGAPIQGLRIVCSGRWSKTRSSRKQRLIYARGSLKRLTFSSLLDYGTTTVTTKFGVFSIKVWILYEPTDALPPF